MELTECSLVSLKEHPLKSRVWSFISLRKMFIVFKERSKAQSHSKIALSLRLVDDDMEHCSNAMPLKSISRYLLKLVFKFMRYPIDAVNTSRYFRIDLENKICKAGEFGVTKRIAFNLGWLQIKHLSNNTNLCNCRFV